MCPINSMEQRFRGSETVGVPGIGVEPVGNAKLFLARQVGLETATLQLTVGKAKA